LGALTFNSAFAVYNSWGDAGSVAFVLFADAALLLLFLCLREFERAGRVRHRIIKAAAWVLTTLLTVMFASRVAPLMPPVVAALVWVMSAATAAGGLALNSMLDVYNSWGDAGSVVFVLIADAALLLLFLCIHEFEAMKNIKAAAVWALQTLLPSPRAGRVNRQLALTMAVFGVLTCNWTLADAGSAAIVFVAYVGLLTTIILFLGELNDRAHSVEHGQHEVEDPSAAHGDVRVEVASTDLLMALFMTAFSVLTCDWALVIHKTCSDMASKVFVFAAYDILLTTVSLFLSKLARIVPALPGAGVVDAAHGDVCVEDGASSPIHGGIE
jgi:hypothetical protein